MYPKTLTKEQTNSIVNLFKRLIKAIKRAIQCFIEHVRKSILKASIYELEAMSEGRSEGQSLATLGEGLRKACVIQRAHYPPKPTEINRLKEYSKEIERLRAIQSRTRKPRVKKKLNRRIKALYNKSMKTAARYL